MRRVVLGLVLIVLLGAACGTSTTPGRPSAHGGTSTTPHRSTTTAPPATTSSSPSALDTLGPYLTQVASIDAALKKAATAVNGDVHVGTVDLSPATKTAVDAADPAPAGAAIPAGLPADLWARVLLVQSDLESRYAALLGFTRSGAPPAVATTDFWGKYALSCLGNGGPAAAATQPDVAALRTGAAALPPLTPAAPDSQAAGDLALALQMIEMQNLGCLSCGGVRMTSPPTIVWYATPQPAPGGPGMPAIDGTINGVDFDGSYSASAGWQLEIHAC